MSEDTWKSEMRRGTLELFILALISRGRTYGYRITKDLRKMSDEISRVEEGVLYPLLRRLEERGLICSSWEEKHGRRRKLYSITQEGKSTLQDMVVFWENLNSILIQLTQEVEPCR